ncbi:MAG: TRAP transporter small permease subunit, partial [Desulfobulbia bacterium]
MILDNYIQVFEKVTFPICRFADYIGRAVLALMVILISLDVTLRYFFNMPIKGSYEVVQFMLAAIVFLGLGYVQKQKGHVSISLITSRLSASQNAVIGSATYLLCLVIFTLIGWRCIVQAEALRLSGSTSDVLSIPHFPFFWLAAFGSILICMVYIIDFLKSLKVVLAECKRPWLWLTIDGIFVLLLATLPVWLNWLPFEISRPAAGVIGIAFLVLLLFSNMPIGPIMALIGFVGFAYLVNVKAGLGILSTSPYRTSSTHALSTIPLFVLMGMLCFQAELSKDIYTTIRNWV